MMPPCVIPKLPSHTRTREATRISGQRPNFDEGKYGLLPIGTTTAFERRANSTKSLALLALNQPIDAKFCLDIAARDGCKDKALSVWMAKVDQAIESGSHCYSSRGLAC